MSVTQNILVLSNNYDNRYTYKENNINTLSLNHKIF